MAYHLQIKFVKSHFCLPPGYTDKHLWAYRKQIQQGHRCKQKSDIKMVFLDFLKPEDKLFKKGFFFFFDAGIAVHGQPIWDCPVLI